MTWRLLVSLTLIIVAAGCDSGSSSSTSRARVPQFDDVAALQQDDLTLGLDFLNRVYEPGRFQLDANARPSSLLEVDRLALYHLNQWLAREARGSSDWKRPALLQYLPKSLAGIQPLSELERMRFTDDDIHFLHGQIWFRDIARRVTKNTPSGFVGERTESQRANLPEKEGKSLANALVLFDWMVRNIQLEKFPAEESAGEGPADALPSQRGVPGPGYQRYPRETLLLGRGDAYERMRVFSELLRQVEIESVILAVAREEGPPRPWAVAALIGDQLYLFDCELGLPVLDKQGVATLASLLASPDALETMQVNDSERYWVKPADLKSLRPLLAASPEQLSKRMQLLESRATGSKAMHLTVPIDELAERLSKRSDLSGAKVGLWRVPLDTWLYVSLGRSVRFQRNQEAALQFDLETLMVRTPSTILNQARQMQFLGLFDMPEDVAARRREQQRDRVTAALPRDGGAIELYLHSRPENRIIEDLPYNTDLQKAYGLPLSRDEKERRKQLEIAVARIQRVRDDSTYWLGLVQCEKGDLENAVKWLSMSLPEEGENPWANGARYNLARTYETLGRRDEALKLYRRDRSPQAYGNHLRAKWLSESSATNAE
jgi:tetratricopeptide (TPR) repeat protein